MAFPYNSYYPTYPQMNVQPQYNPQNQNTGGIIWVQGEAGAKSYMVAPNTTVQLWKSVQPRLYDAVLRKFE